MFIKNLPQIAGSALLLALASSVIAETQPGALDLEFLAPVINNDIDAMVVAGERIIVGGQFTDAGPRIAAFELDGTPDADFDAGSGANDAVTALAVGATGEIFVAGQFSSFNGVTRRNLVRLTESGGLDTDFDGSGFNSQIRSVIAFPDGKVLAAGWFSNVQGRAVGGIARLNPDGTRDDTFGVTTGTNQLVNAMIQLNDGRIVIGGGFTQYNGNASNRIAVLNEDGSWDDTFQVGSGFNGVVSAMTPLASGGLLVAGSFSSYNGAPCQRLARLNSDGTLDTSFNAGTGPNSTTVNAIIEETNGRIIVAGSFSSVDGVARANIARLMPNGALDLGFDPGEGANSAINAVAVLDGQDRIFIAGDFSNYNLEPVSRLARIIGGGETEGRTGFPTWITRFFPSADESRTAPGADPDGDGVPNLLEYALGGDPSVQDRGQLPLVVPVAHGGEDYLEISFTRRQEAWDVIYLVEATDDLLSWTNIWSSADHPYLSGQEEYTETVMDLQPMHARRFIRLNVMLDPDAEYQEPPPANEGLEGWLAGFFNEEELADPSISGWDADPDGDGIPNLLEYAFNRNPLSASRAGLPESTLTEVGGQLHLAISFARVRDASGISYRVEASPDLKDWTEIWSSDDFPYESEEETVIETVADVEPMTAGKRFLRVNVVGDGT